MTGPHSDRTRWQVGFGATLAIFAAGCTQGPDFTPPPAPVETGYTAEPMPAETAATANAAAQHFQPGADITADWWQLYRSADLDQIVKAAIEGSPNLTQARATLRQAHEVMNEAAGALLPQVNANAGISYNKLSLIQFGQAQGFPSFPLYTIGAAVTYDTDIFGAERRTVEAEAAREEADHHELAAAYLTLTGNAVGTAVTLAATREEMRAVDDIIEADQRNLNLLDQSVRGGRLGAESPEYLSAVAQLDNDRNLQPPLRLQLDQSAHALAVLAGRPPAGFTPPAFDFANLKLPTELPVSLPSALVEQRPDILAASADLHAASAEIGVAAAHLLPNVNLSAEFSYNATSPDKLFSPVGILNDVAGQITAPIFHGGTLEAQKRAAEAAYDAADAQYRQAVLAALQQVADVLRALDHDAVLARGEEQAVAAARRSLNSAQRSLGAGAASYTQVLDATRQYQQARIGYVRALARRYQDTAQLFVAMGGGWWHAQDLETGPKI